jgi:hypothetical protein
VSCVEQNRDWGARSKKPSEGSRWRGERGRVSKLNEARSEGLKLERVGTEAEVEAVESVGGRIEGENGGIEGARSRDQARSGAGGGGAR